MSWDCDVKHLPGQDMRLDNAGCARLCPVHCRIRPYWIKAAPHAAPLARRQRPGSALAARPPHTGPHPQGTDQRGSQVTQPVRLAAVFLAPDCPACSRRV
jgi:hypothetical protein